MQTTLTKIRTLILNAKNISDPKKKEMLRYVETLDHELTELAKDKQEDAKKIAYYAHLKTEKALGENATDHSEDEITHGFKGAVEEFEISHPKLYQTLQTLSISLSSLGV